MQKEFIIVIGVLIASNIWFYKSYSSATDKLDLVTTKLESIEQEFSDYKVDLAKKLDRLNVYNESNHLESVKTITRISKLEKDSKRVDTVKAKPELVAKLVTKSFNTFTKELQEETK